MPWCHGLHLLPWNKALACISGIIHRASLYLKTVWKWYNEKVNCRFSDSTLDYILTDNSRKCQPSGNIYRKIKLEAVQTGMQFLWTRNLKPLVYSSSCSMGHRSQTLARSDWRSLGTILTMSTYCYTWNEVIASNASNKAISVMTFKMYSSRSRWRWSH